ncbi:hypothetical protein EVB94_363 [Rhizobium phage RHph_TM40]|nr:hypothetical protein EVB94_363 [Rhizobium phage RHph_TM40]
MIGVKGQYVASFDINGRNFLGNSDLKRFMVVEEAGNTLPTFELTFESDSDEVISHMNEKSVINAAMGLDTLELSNMRLKPMKKELSRRSGSSYIMTVKGLYDRIEYLTGTDVMVTPKQSAIATMSQIVSKHFIPDFDISASSDIQNWIQHSITDKSFVNELWTRSDLGSKNFPMVAITSDGRFRLRSIENVMAGSPKFILSNRNEGPNTIYYDTNYVIEADTGFMNYWQGYSRSNNVIDLDGGLLSLFSSVVSQVMSMGSSLEQSASALLRTGENLILNENTNKKFHEAKSNNLANLATFSSNKLTVNCSNRFFPVRALDLVKFTDGPTTREYSSENYSGYWIVSKVARIIEDYSFKTNLVLNREAMNGAVGNN